MFLLNNEVAVEALADKDTYSRGEEVKLSVTVANRGPRPVRLFFPSAQRYDFIVTREGREVWRWSTGRFFAMVLGEVVLEPGERETYAAIWKPEAAAPGEYDAIGIIASQPPLQSKRSFRISG